MNLTMQHREYFLNKALSPELTEQYKIMATASLQQQQQIEAADSLSFDEFLTDYYQQYKFSL